MSIKPLTVEISYAEYCNLIGVASGAQQTALPLIGPVANLVSKFASTFSQLKAEFDLGAAEIYKAFSNHDMYALLKAVAFDIKKLYTAVVKFTDLIPQGLFKVIKKFQDSDLFLKLKSGVAQVDDVLTQYPLLKRLAGPALAGLLLWMWLSASFVGSIEFDMNLDLVVMAFTGKFTIYDLFLSPSGLSLIAAFAIGSVTGIGVAWLGNSRANLVMALMYTGLKKANLGKIAEGMLKRHIPVKKA